MGGPLRPRRGGCGREAATTVRPMTPADVAAAAAIEAVAFSDPWSARSFQEMLEQSHAICLVATDAGGNPTLRKISVTVNWTDGGRPYQVKLETLASAI